MKRFLLLALSLALIITMLSSVTVNAADPIIVQGQPSSFSVALNTAVQLEFLFFGGDSPVIQWQSGSSANGPWADVAGANEANYSPSTSAAGTTFYRCVVTDVTETIISDSAMVQVYSGSTAAGAVVGYPASGGTVGKNQAIFLYSNTAAANGLQIFYETGATSATTDDPTVNSTLYDGSYAVVVPPTGTSFCIKARAYCTTGSPSAIATLTYTIDNTNNRLSDIKNDPDFLAWKANNWEGGAADYDFPWTGNVPTSVYNKITQIIDRMTNAEKSTFLGGEGNGSQRLGSSGGSIRAMAALGIPQTGMPDGPAGLRINASASYSASASSPAQRRTTYWPNGSSRSATWNKELNKKMGEAFGQEMYYFGTDLILMPGMNLHRSVLNGRNFEYYSEDPLLSGMTAAYETLGIQSNHVGVTLKHYFGNNQETGRSNHVTTISARANRELYLRNFEYAITVGHPWAIMNSYNQVNGTSTASSRELNTQITRNEFGFTGFIMTDWGSGTNVGGNAGPMYNGSRLSAGSGARVWSGNDLAQMGQTANEITNAVTNANHPLTQSDVDLAVRRLLEFVVKTPIFNNKPPSQGLTPQWLMDEDRALAREVGDEAVILMKNEMVAGKPALPLAVPTGTQRIIGIGTTMNTLVNGGTGSGAVNMISGETIPGINEALNSRIGAANWINANSVSGVTTTNAENVIPTTVWDSWKTQDITAVVFAFRRTSGEGSDVSGTGSPSGTTKTGYLHSTEELNLMTQAQAFCNELEIPFIVIMNQGTWTRMSTWDSRADGIIMGWQQGMAGGLAMVDVLFGDVNPSGKTPTTVPFAITGNNNNGQNTNRYNPAEQGWGQSATTNVYYYEGIYMGYRYFDTFNVPVSYPFGFGLSYTKFNYSNAKLSKTSFAGKGDKLTASVTITNTGKVAGKEIVEFYIGAPGIQMPKPVKELKGYEKTKLLEPGESQTITVEFDDMALASYSDGKTAGAPADGSWCVEAGHYAVYFAASSQDIRATRSFTIADSFVVKTVDGSAMAPSTTLENTLFGNNAINPTQITVSFVPGGGLANFQKAYSVMGSAYNYLPVCPIDGIAWEWYTSADLTTKVTESTLVPSAATTLYAKWVMPAIELVVAGDKATASASVYHDSATPVNATLIIAVYDAAGRMLSTTSDNVVAVAANTPTAISVSIPVSGTAASVKAFLWESDTYIPLVENAVVII